MNYYRDQLNRININSEYYTNIQIIDGKGNKTNYLNLNKESIKELRAFLDKLEDKFNKEELENMGV